MKQTVLSTLPKAVFAVVLFVCLLRSSTAASISQQIRGVNTQQTSSEPVLEEVNAEVSVNNGEATQNKEGCPSDCKNKDAWIVAQQLSKKLILKKILHSSLSYIFYHQQYHT